jgi:hypothetical protein
VIDSLGAPGTASPRKALKLPYRWFELDSALPYRGIPLTTSFLTSRPVSLVFVSATYPTEICKAIAHIHGESAIFL